MKATIYVGDVLDRLREMPDESVQCVVSSPPYWGLRDYGVEGQIGLEPTPAAYIAKMTEVFREVRRVLRADGTCWVNMGDCYAGSGRGGNTSDTSGLEGTTESQEQSRKARGSTKPTVLHAATIAAGAVGRAWTPAPAGLKKKDLVGMPWRLAFALQDDGWWLRQDIVWSKPNPMPESVTDRCTKAHEYIFLLTKSARYFYDAEAIKEDCIADHPAGNQAHKGTTAYLEGDQHHRTKQGLVAFAQRTRQVPDAYKGSIPGRKGGPGQDRRGNGDRGLGAKGAVSDASEVRSGKGAAFGRGAGWRDDPTALTEKRNRRSVWEIATEGFAEAHFATFPTKLVEPCILAGSKVGDVVLDPFTGSGTTGVVALRYQRDFVGIELNPQYAEMAERRIGGEIPLFAGVELIHLAPVLVKQA